MTNPQPPPREFSHPVLWTVGLVAACLLLGAWFWHWLGQGTITGRDHGALPAAQPQQSAVDHQALIADRSQAVLDRGAEVYAKNCAACHGPKGQPDPAMRPAPRNFANGEAFKAPHGAGPYGWYLTLSKGWGTMPAFANLGIEDRYAVAHFVRETWMKKGAAYVADDADEVKKQIPAKGSAAPGAGLPPVDPVGVRPPKPTWPLLAVVAGAAEAEATAVRAWSARAAAGAAPELASPLTRIAALAERRPQVLAAARDAARAGDAARVAALIAGDAGTGAGDAALALLPAATLNAVAARLVATADAAPGVH